MRRVTAGLVALVSGGAAIAAGASLVAGNMTTTQPGAAALEWHIPVNTSFSDPLPIVDGQVQVFTSAPDGVSLPVTVTSAGAAEERFTYVSVARDGTVDVTVPPQWSGCVPVYLSTPGLPTLSAVVDRGQVACPSPAKIELFTRFGIPPGDVPESTVADLLTYLLEVTENVTLDALPADYRLCLQQPDAGAVNACLLILRGSGQ